MKSINKQGKGRKISCYIQTRRSALILGSGRGDNRMMLEVALQFGDVPDPWGP